MWQRTCELYRLSYAVGNRNYFFLGFFHLQKSFLKEMAVRMSVLIKLIIHDQRAILTNRFFNVSCVPSVKFAGFVSIGGIWVRGG